MTAGACPSWCADHEDDDGESLHFGTDIEVSAASVSVKPFRFENTGSGVAIYDSRSDQAAELTPDEARRLITALQHALNLAEEVTP